MMCSWSLEAADGDVSYLSYLMYPRPSYSNRLAIDWMLLLYPTKYSQKVKGAASPSGSFLLAEDVPEAEARTA